ncbi:MAG: DUF952 domain-containing protein [Microthrixaceae bacterium]
MDPSHGHPHGDPSAFSSAFGPRLARVLYGVAAALALATVVGLVVLWPSDSGPRDFGSLGVADDYYDAVVTRVESFVCPGEEQDGPGLCQEVTFELSEGPDAGSERSVQLFDVGPYPELSVGDRIVVPYLEEALPEFQYSQSFERERTAPMLALAALFALLVVVQGRLRGLAALAGLAASIAVLIVFMLPALTEGGPPVPVALVAASLIAFLALYLAHGVNPLTTVALLGTLASLALVAVLSWVFTSATVLSGIGEEAQYIRAFGGELDFQGLLLAGMIIGALGALDDMTVTQSSVVAELRSANPSMGFRELFRAGSRVGRDHIASTVNTLALAYAGASLPLLLVFVTSERSIGGVLTSEVVAAEVVRTLVGSIGLVASVPLTTALAAGAVAVVPQRRGDTAEEPIYHLALADEWERASATGADYDRSTIGASLADEGFVHASFAPQVEGTAEAFYRGRDIVLLTIDPGLLGAPVRIEEVGDGWFPHIYGPVPRAAVVDAQEVPRRADGTHDFEGLLP